MDAAAAAAERRGAPEAQSDLAALAAQVEAAWAAGTAGWDALAAVWGATPGAPDARATLPPATVAACAPAAPTPDAAALAGCWWDAPPWCGQIPDAEFRAIVAVYVAHHGRYTPDLPAREPGVLREWLRARGDAGAATPQAAA
jgi:hypothetical protein